MCWVTPRQLCRNMITDIVPDKYNKTLFKLYVNPNHEQTKSVYFYNI